MEIVFSDNAIKHYEFWKKSGNKAVQNKISELIVSVSETPYEGIGKPEALKYELLGKSSRRINKEHRLVYEVDEQNEHVIIHSMKGHY